MNRLFLISATLILTIMLLILPTAQAADIELSDTCSLADAITAANTDKAVGECPAGDGADTIKLSGSITLDATLPHITSEITIEGRGFTISGNERFRIFYVSAGTLTIDDLIMTKGMADEIDIGGQTYIGGGAIVNLGELSITGGTFADNLADYGGAIYNRSSRLSITNSTFTNNYAYLNGGAIYNRSSRLSITNSTFTNNHSVEERGGAIDNQGELSITDSTFLDNSADIGGGALHNYGNIVSSSVSIINSTFTGNSTDGNEGGAISNRLAKLSITGSTFTSNSARFQGGAVYNYNSRGELGITNSIFVGNHSDGDGGAIKSTDSELSVTNSTFIENSADDGGAIYNRSGKLSITNSTFSGNHSDDYGGGIYFLFEGSLRNKATFTHLTLVNNFANHGGGLYVGDDEQKPKVVNLHNSLIASNSGGDCVSELNHTVNSLIQDGSCFPTLMGDPMLGELVEPYDGSPAYYPLLEGSPAIDAADGKHCPKTDQVGTKRPQGSGCDIGAYELPTASDN